MSGDADILVQARSALLDALDALEDHRDSVVVIGAQAIYLHTGSAQVALAEATKDSDLALDVLEHHPDPVALLHCRQLATANDQQVAWQQASRLHPST